MDVSPMINRASRKMDDARPRKSPRMRKGNMSRNKDQSAVRRENIRALNHIPIRRLLRSDGLRLPLLVILLVLLGLGALGTAAQEATPDPNQAPVQTTEPPLAPAQAPPDPNQIQICTVKPPLIVKGQSAILEVTGSN